MSYKVLFVLNALVALVFGVAFLVVPTRSLEFFGTETYEATVLMTQFFGTGLISAGLLLWSVRDVADTKIQRGIGWAQLISLIVGLVVNVIGISPASGVIRLNGWITVIVYVVLALCYAFMLFMKPKMKE